MGKSVKDVSLGMAVAACASFQAARTFVPIISNSGGQALGQHHALRGAEAAEGITSSFQCGNGVLSMGLLGATGASALAACARPSGKVARPVICRPAAAATAEGEAPPPPPFNPAKQLGTTDPLGFFDPAGFSKVGDEAGFYKLRVAELKHGRVAMMAAVGAVIQHYVQFPGFQDVPKGLGAVASPPGLYGFAVLFAVSGAFELLVWKDDPAKGVDSVGDYGNPLQLGLGQPLGEGGFMKNAEINNGRASMFAILGIMVAELATGKDGMQQLGFS